MNPENLKYHKEHTWARIEGDKATIGITDHAQKELGDIVYIDLPDTETAVEAGVEMSEIESTKATSSVISPVSGDIIEVNEELSDTPEIINESPYDKGWIAVIKLSAPEDAEDLMDSDDYSKLTKEEE